jgi:hypothetical protein
LVGLRFRLRFLTFQFDFPFWASCGACVSHKVSKLTNSQSPLAHVQQIPSLLVSRGVLGIVGSLGVGEQ